MRRFNNFLFWIGLLTISNLGSLVAQQSDVFFKSFRTGHFYLPCDQACILREEYIVCKSSTKKVFKTANSITKVNTKINFSDSVFVDASNDPRVNLNAVLTFKNDTILISKLGYFSLNGDFYIMNRKIYEQFYFLLPRKNRNDAYTLNFLKLSPKVRKKRGYNKL